MKSSSLFLASKSPRRRELLAQIGVPYQVIHVDVVEQIASGESPDQYVARLAREKALAGLRSNPEGCVLGADTVVVRDEQILEKPRDFAHAREMLQLLSANTHRVITGVALACESQLEHCVVSTEVTFRSISLSEITQYWRTGEPQDKAGAYGIQGFGAVFVSHISGSYSNVVGLPLYQTHQLIQRRGIEIWRETVGE